MKDLEPLPAHVQSGSIDNSQMVFVIAHSINTAAKVEALCYDFGQYPRLSYCMSYYCTDSGGLSVVWKLKWL